MKIPVAWALREVWKEGYSLKDFWADTQAGVVVGIVAIPLAMALAIASGVPPQNGLYTALIAGVVVSLLGGSRYQVSGPTAAFVVLLLPVVLEHGLGGLLLAGLFAGILLICFGVLGLGSVIQIMPHPVTTGFTSGIALVIASIQLKDFFGLTYSETPKNFIGQLRNFASSLQTLHVEELGLSLFTLAVLMVFVKWFKRTPAPIAALILGTMASYGIEALLPGTEIARILTRFHGIPQGAPAWHWPWETGAGLVINQHNLTSIFTASIGIALLGAIESLLSAVVADGMTGKKHDPNAELVALGICNVICPFFGGIPATGAIARTTTNIRFGARSPIASAVHGGFVLLVLVLLARWIEKVPMASLAALLIFVAWNMSERRNFVNILKIGSWDDRIPLLICFVLTVLFDMTIGVGAGVLMATLLFAKRVAALTESGVLNADFLHTENSKIPIPKGVFVYRIVGSLFFGAAYAAVDAIGTVSNDVKTVILDLSEVAMIDITGAVALDSCIQDLLKKKRQVLLVIPEERVRDVLNKHQSLKKTRVFDSLEEALSS